jgi:hypothetical protein
VATGPDGHGCTRLRASRADREQAIDALKAAYVQGRLTKDELDERVGLALVPLTHAELAALTGDLPDGLTAARRPRGAGQGTVRLRESNAAKAGVFAALVAGARWGSLAVPEPLQSRSSRRCHSAPKSSGPMPTI